MTFDADEVETFLDQFDETSPKIRGFDGCDHLELWRDEDDPRIFTTYSHWEDAAALDRYRSSELFRSTWADVKPLFADQPEAHSYAIERGSAMIDERVPTSIDSPLPNDD